MSTTQLANPVVLVERRDAVGRLIISRPPLNILDIAAIRELRAQLEALLGDPAVRLVEVRGAGENAFCAGAEIRDHFPDRAPEMLREFHLLIRAALDARCPTVAVVKGHCLGGGMELAIACDFIVASRDARFGQPEIKVGAFPPVAAALLPRLMPQRKALEMILTGESISAEQAAHWGLVNRMAEAGQLDAAVEEFESGLLAHSPLIAALARRAARLGSRDALESLLRESERIYLEELIKTEDAREGLNAFVEKRRPQWQGR